jgi:uncharacterized membrane protein required for colicin V production
MVLFAVFALFLYSFFAEYAGLTFDLISDPTVSLMALFLLSFIILIVEPLYICMGFGIYINSRSIVEGWDIELGFNSFVDEKKKSTAKIIPIIVSFLLLSNIFQPMQLQAEEWYQNNFTEVPTEVLDEVLLSEDFGTTHTRKWIRFKDMNADDSSSGFNIDGAMMQEIVGFILRLILILVMIAAIIFIVLRLHKMKEKLSSNKNVLRKNVPGFADTESPEQLIDVAQQLFVEGQVRKAWAACLSAVLRLYAKNGNIIFALNDTETDCLVKINHSALWGKEESSQLILRWITFAYAGIEPLPEQFYESISFYKKLKAMLIHSGDAHE